MAAATHGGIRHAAEMADSDDDGGGGVSRSPSPGDYDSANSDAVDVGDLAGDRESHLPGERRASAARRRAAALSQVDEASAGLHVAAPALEGRATAKRTAHHEASTISAALSAVTGARGEWRCAAQRHRTSC